MGFWIMGAAMGKKDRGRAEHAERAGGAQQGSLGALLAGIGRNVRQVRERQRLTKALLCLMANVSRPQLNKIERGAVDVRLSTILRIAEALDVPLEELIRAGER